MDRKAMQDFISRAVTDALKPTVGDELRTEPCSDCAGTGGGTAPGVWCRSCEGCGKRGATIVETLIDVCRRHNANRPPWAKAHYQGGVFGDSYIVEAKKGPLVAVRLEYEKLPPVVYVAGAVVGAITTKGNRR